MGYRSVQQKYLPSIYPSAPAIIKVLKGSYIRVGDADLPMTDYELYSYEAFRKHLHDDERPIQRASLSTLNQDVLQRYLLERRPIACLSRCLKTVAENLW